ncbi:hypothetical protein [Pseudomonas glycinae]|uniref:hypothetical protein n=1 Tax=Pseudomonas glycinae TaxID=1785145 RepID=UPI00167CFF16|nr:hypothetical protein [Pseudomonas glycinae]
MSKSRWMPTSRPWNDNRDLHSALINMALREMTLAQTENRPNALARTGKIEPALQNLPAGHEPPPTTDLPPALKSETKSESKTG